MNAAVNTRGVTQQEVKGETVLLAAHQLHQQAVRRASSWRAPGGFSSSGMRRRRAPAAAVRWRA